MNYLRVIKVSPGIPAKVKVISKGLSSLQREVGGLIEVIYPFDDPIGLVCNENGKLDGLPLNRSLRDEKGEIYDIIAGDFLIVGLGDEDFTDLSDELTEKYLGIYSKPESFFQINGKLIVLCENQSGT